MATRETKEDGGVVGRLAGKGEEALTRVMEGLGKNPRVTDALDRAMSAKGRLDDASRTALAQVGLAASEEIRELRSQVERLERRLAKLEGETGATTAKRTESKETPSAKRTTKSATSKAKKKTEQAVSPAAGRSIGGGTARGGGGGGGTGTAA